MLFCLKYLKSRNMNRIILQISVFHAHRHIHMHFSLKRQISMDKLKISFVLHDSTLPLPLSLLKVTTMINLV